MFIVLLLQYGNDQIACICGDNILIMDKDLWVELLDAEIYLEINKPLQQNKWKKQSMEKHWFS